MKKLMALLVALTLICGTFGACETASNTDETSGSPSDVDGSLDLFAVTFGEEDFKEFTDAVDSLKTLAIEGTDEAAVVEAMDRVDLLYQFCYGQMEISNIVYFSTMSDEDNEVFNRMTEYNSKEIAVLADAKREIYLAGSPFCDIILDGYSEAELEALAVSDPEVILKYTNKVDSIRDKYFKLDPKSEMWDATVKELYTELIRNGNALAKEYGYDDYYEYVSAEKFFRDYEIDKKAFREYVAEYLVPLYVQVADHFKELTDAATQEDFNAMRALSYGSQAETVDGFISRFVDSFDGSIKEKMESLFDGRHILRGGADSYQMACAVDLAYYGEAVCYFSTGYYGAATTVAHEMGHFVSMFCYDTFTATLDFIETHSQATEVLFWEFVKNGVTPGCYELYKYSELLAKLSMVIMSTVVDEFEEITYSAEEPYAVDEIDGIIDALNNKYGIDTVDSLDLNRYIKTVVIENPIYYFSYATSGMSALELYCILKESGTDAAYDVYEKLQEGPTDVTYSENLEFAGLDSTFGEELFKKVSNVIMNDINAAR